MDVASACARRGSLLADITGDGLVDVLGFNSKLDPNFPVVTLVNTTRAVNRPPTGLSLHGTIRRPYRSHLVGHGSRMRSTPSGPPTDPDMHALRFRWTLPDGTVFSTFPWLFPNQLLPGSYQVTVTVDDYRGGSINDTFTLEVPPFKETVLLRQLPRRVALAPGSAWKIDGRLGARVGSGCRRAQATEPLANPMDYFDMGFVADPRRNTSCGFA